MCLSVSRRIIAGGALIHEGDFDRVACGFLDLFGRRSDLRPVLLVFVSCPEYTMLRAESA
jgi:hypothetical protein